MKHVRIVLYLLLVGLAVVMTAGTAAKANMWGFAAAYWAVVTLKWLTDLAGRGER